MFITYDDKFHIMKKIILAIFLMMTLTLAVSAYEVDDTFINGLNTTDDVSDVLGQKQDKNVMLIFDQDSCVYCDLLKENVLSDSNVQKELNSNYIVVIVDINKYPDVAAKYNVFGTPTTVVVNSTGDEIYRLEGYVESDEFQNALKEI